MANVCEGACFNKGQFDKLCVHHPSNHANNCACTLCFSERQGAWKGY